MERLSQEDEKGRFFTYLFLENVLEVEVVREKENTPEVGYKARGTSIDRLAAYEDTGRTPEEVEALKADNDRLHQLIDELESGLRKESNNA